MGRLTPFVGRADALQVLDDARRAARLGRLRGVVIAGPAGIGKSRLVAEFLANAPQVGVRASGRCTADDHHLAPLWPIREVLADLGVVDLIDAGTTPQEHGHRVQQVAEVLRGGARRAGLLTLVLEDLHWADATSLQLSRFLIRALANEPILLVATHRDGHEVSSTLRDLLTALDRDPHTCRLDLGPLDRPEVAAMAEHRLGHRLDEAALDRLAARSEGFPLFVEWLIATGERADEIPVAVRDLFLVQLDRLGTWARSVVEHAAVCGSEFRHELLADVIDADPSALEAGLDDLLDAGILVAAGTGADYRFRHALLHETVYAELRPMLRRRLHGRCAQVLTGSPHLASPLGWPAVALAALGAGGEPRDVARPPPVGADTVVDAPARLGLTRREMEVLDLLSRGWSNKRIGAQLSVSPRTVGTHVSHILAKLGVETRGEAVALVFRATPADGPGGGRSVR